MENLANLAILAFAINKKLEGLLVVVAEVVTPAGTAHNVRRGHSARSEGCGLLC